ncbi:MAG: bifunctional pyr operon transcriptional regulator/uracil phosphoribosyltransferase PyrR [Gemmatimonadales bacterium]|nr:MAG: bifunctional pyr operon transcriptional regulator/uracil phosphoribosyltransferase PyrR [Gemmatimonadales bacterium]
MSDDEPATLEQRVTLMDPEAVTRVLARMSREIVERNEGTADLVLLGIRRRGVELAERIQAVMEAEEGVAIPSGALDITLYRDDLGTVGPRPVIGESTLPLEGIDDRTVVVIDDVLYTGRTARAAMNELMDWGRPSRIFFCVLVDRGGRELPIQPDIVGRVVSALPDQVVEVLVPEEDGRLAVELITRATETP